MSFQSLGSARGVRYTRPVRKYIRIKLSCSVCVAIFNKRGTSLTARRRISIKNIISRVNSKSQFRSSLPRSIIIYVRTKYETRSVSHLFAGPTISGAEFDKTSRLIDVEFMHMSAPVFAIVN